MDIAAPAPVFDHGMVPITYYTEVTRKFLTIAIDIVLEYFQSLRCVDRVEWGTRNQSAISYFALAL